MIKQIKIPKRYRNVNKRVSWHFIFDKDGEVNPVLSRRGLGVLNLTELLEHILPHKIISTISMAGGNPIPDEMDNWFREHLTGCWQLWMLNGDMRQAVYYFENASDALHFKMRWM